MQTNCIMIIQGEPIRLFHPITPSYKKKNKPIWERLHKYILGVVVNLLVSLVKIMNHYDNDFGR